VAVVAPVLASWLLVNPAHASAGMDASCAALTLRNSVALIALSVVALRCAQSTAATVTERPAAGTAAEVAAVLAMAAHRMIASAIAVCMRS